MRADVFANGAGRNGDGELEFQSIFWSWVDRRSGAEAPRMLKLALQGRREIGSVHFADEESEVDGDRRTAGPRAPWCRLPTLEGSECGAVPAQEGLGLDDDQSLGGPPVEDAGEGDQGRADPFCRAMAGLGLALLKQQGELFSEEEDLGDEGEAGQEE